jgi:DNA-binding NtrC family response regulator
VILCGEGYLETRHLPPAFGQRFIRQDAATSNYSESGVHVEIGSTVDEAERMLILKTLESTRNNKTKAAEILGISLKTLHNKLKEYRERKPFDTSHNTGPRAWQKFLDYTRRASLSLFHFAFSVSRPIDTRE